MKNLIMTIAVAIFTTFAASAQFMVVTTVNTPDSDLNEEWGTTNFTDNLGIGYIYNDKCVVGLVSEPSRLSDIRKNRINILKETESTNYTNFEKISKEVEESKKMFKKYGWPMIDVTRKSVEEIAASVIKIYNIFKDKDND